MPHLSKDERANSLHGSPLDETTMLKMSATTRGRGKCDKIEGLVFDTAQPMFEPQNWKYPITKNIVSIDLELCVEGFNGIDNVESHLAMCIDTLIGMSRRYCQPVRPLQIITVPCEAVVGEESEACFQPVITSATRDVSLLLPCHQK